MHRFSRFDSRLLAGVLVLGAIVISFSGPLRPGQAQEPPPDVEAGEGQQAAAGALDEDAVEEGDPQEAVTPSLGGMIIQSGWIGIPFYIFLGLLSILATAVVLERLLHLTARRVLPDEFVRRLGELISADEMDPRRYRALCDSSASPAASVLKAGVLRAGRSLLEVEKAMEDAMAKEMSAMRGRHRPLNVVGSIAPLVGLLGTVVGMIFAFYQSSQAGLGKAEVLAEYIYLALITTALGLTVAIPALLFSAWFSARVERFMREIDECLIDMLPVFTAMEGAAPPKTRIRDDDESDSPQPLAASTAET